MSKVRGPKSPSNSSAVKDTTKQKKRRVSQQRLSDKKTSEQKNKLNRGSDTDVERLNEKTLCSDFSSSGVAYITHVPLVLQLYFLFSRRESVMRWGLVG